MSLFPDSPSVTFRACAPEGIWQVTRDGALTSEYPAREDAVRAACVAAREVESLGGSAQVLLAPGEAVIRHREPYFDDAPDLLPPYSLLSERPH